MRRRWGVALALLCASIPLALAQTAPGVPDQYVPRLADIMDAAQTRHMKLWLAGEAQNWELAAFELRQLRGSLTEAAIYYAGIPVTNITTLATPLQSALDAVEAKDARRFAKSYGELTDGCNACHRSMGRSFLVMRAPTGQPFGNQIFSPPGKK